MNYQRPMNTESMTVPRIISEIKQQIANRSNKQDAIELLDKAVRESESDVEYGQALAFSLQIGSTLERREVFSRFGDYLEKPRETFPWYPFHDAVNLIDSGIHCIRLGVTLSD